MQSPSQVAIAAMRRLRGGRLSAQKLAERMQSHGVDWNRATVANIELGRRKALTVEELLALALALDVPLTALLVPPGAAAVTLSGSSHDSLPTHQALSWLTSDQDAPGTSEAWRAATRPVQLVRSWRRAECMALLLLLADDGTGDVDAQLAARLGALATAAGALHAAGLEAPDPHPQLAEAAARLGVPVDGQAVTGVSTDMPRTTDTEEP